jgi:hypothetical protein
LFGEDLGYLGLEHAFGKGCQLLLSAAEVGQLAAQARRGSLFVSDRRVGINLLELAFRLLQVARDLEVVEHGLPAAFAPDVRGHAHARLLQLDPGSVQRPRRVIELEARREEADLFWQPGGSGGA